MTLRAIYTTGQAANVDFFARNNSGQWWNTAGTPAFEDYDSGNLIDYRIAPTETPAGSGLYESTEPTGTVEFELRLKAATLALSTIVAGPETIGGNAKAVVQAIKEDDDLGTADGGLVAEVNKIPRSATAVTAGAATTETREVVTDSTGTLVETRVIT